MSTFNITTINETEYLREDIKPLTGKFRTVYLFNADEETYCAELTPSYWLEAVGITTEHEISDDLYDCLTHNLHESSHYRHCRNLTSQFFGYFDSIEDAVEAYHANPRY